MQVQQEKRLGMVEGEKTMEEREYAVIEEAGKGWRYVRSHATLFSTICTTTDLYSLSLSLSPLSVSTRFLLGDSYLLSRCISSY